MTMQIPTSLAHFWLAPLLPALSATFAQVSLCVRTDAGGDPDVDLVLQWGEPGPGPERVLISSSMIGAYASPRLLAANALHDPRDLLSAPLLLEQDDTAWSRWFDLAGVALEAAPRGLRFADSTGLALEAAVGGGGVALGDQLCVAGFVAQGALSHQERNTPAGVSSAPSDTV
jgi:DNA-binding transcriptional LysR family regulator